MPDELALIPPQAGAGDTSQAAAMAARLAAPHLFDFLLHSLPTPVGEMPSAPGRLPAEWQRPSSLDVIPALTDVAGLVGPGATGKTAGAIFVGPGSRLLAHAFRDAPRDPRLREAFVNSVQRMREIAGLEPATFPARTDWSGAAVRASGVPNIEIEDTGARLVPSKVPGEYLWKHPAGDLHALYDVPPVQFDATMPRGNAQANLNTRQITIGGSPNDPGVMQRANYIAAHEFQHIIQHAEGLPTGATAVGSVFEPEYWRAVGKTMPPRDDAGIGRYQDEMTRIRMQHVLGAHDQPEIKAAYDIYRRSAGETEARNVQRRMEDPALYALAPRATEDVPRDRQIVRYYTPPGAQVPRRIAPVAGDPFAERLELVPTQEPTGLVGPGYDHRSLVRPAGEQGFADFYIKNDQGAHVGDMTINTSDPKNLWIEWIGGHSPGKITGSMPNVLGPKEIRSLLDEIRNKFPEAETISGFRASGARYAGKPHQWTPDAAAGGFEPVIRLRGGKPPPEFEGLGGVAKPK